MTKTFFIMLPPPNISGSLHMGHALNFFLQDFLVKTAKIILPDTKTFLLPGVDHGGISTQYSALKHIENLRTLSPEEKFKKIENFAQTAKLNILKQMYQFNLSCNFDQLQYTMDEKHIQLVNDSFVTLYKKGLITEDERIVYWDQLMGTSLSSLEVVHKNIQESLYYIKYKLLNKEEFIIIATTRPETLFGDVALAVGIRNQYLAGLQAIIPIINKVIPIIFDEIVDDNFGTGILKITPGHDEKDFEFGKKYKLDVINIYDENLLMNNNVPEEYQNLTANKTRILLLRNLEKYNLLEKEEIISHNVLFGEKSNSRIETIVKKQWYLNLSNGAQKALELLKNGTFKIFPSYWEKTYELWLKNLQPWCISREILWGHAIPVWRTKNKRIIVASTYEEAEKEANGEVLIRDKFLLDTWFSSALWPLLYKQQGAEFYPSDVLVTAYDIIFFWVARMVMMSLELDNSLPFKNVLIHNLIRDEKGEKMSKTRGNVLDPLELMNIYENKDILRISLLNHISLRGQINFKKENMEVSKKFITKFINAIKFLQLNYTPDDFLSINNLEDKYIDNEICIYFLNKLKILEPEQLLQDYNIQQYIKNLNNFFWDDYCDWFLEMSKKQLTCKEIQFTLIFIIKKLLGLFYGLLPDFTTNIYNILFQQDIGNHFFDTNMQIIYTLENIKKIEDLIYIIKQLRSLNDMKILTGMLLENSFQIKNEDRIYLSLRIKTINIYICEEKNYDYLIIRKKKIFFETINKEKLKIILTNKRNEYNNLLNKINIQKPPEDILITFQYRIILLKEEIFILNKII
jgi:valyl-tRNA synthetase